MAQQPLVSHGLIVEASLSHSGTPHSVGLLWTSDRPEAETSLPYNTQHSQIDRHAPAAFEPTILASEQPHTHALNGVAAWIYIVNN